MAAPQTAAQQAAAEQGATLFRMPRRQLSNSEFAFHQSGLWKGIALGLALLIIGFGVATYMRQSNDLNQTVEIYERARVFERLSGGPPDVPKISVSEGAKAAQREIADGATP